MKKQTTRARGRPWTPVLCVALLCFSGLIASNVHATGAAPPLDTGPQWTHEPAVTDTSPPAAFASDWKMYKLTKIDSAFATASCLIAAHQYMLASASNGVCIFATSPDNYYGGEYAKCGVTIGKNDGGGMTSGGIISLDKPCIGGITSGGFASGIHGSGLRQDTGAITRAG